MLILELFRYRNNRCRCRMSDIADIKIDVDAHVWFGYLTRIRIRLHVVGGVLLGMLNYSTMYMYTKSCPKCLNQNVKLYCTMYMYTKSCPKGLTQNVKLYCTKYIYMKSCPKFLIQDVKPFCTMYMYMKSCPKCLTRDVKLFCTLYIFMTFCPYVESTFRTGDLTSVVNNRNWNS